MKDQHVTVTDQDAAATTVKRRLQDRGIEFSREDAWQRIQDHVSTHKYMIDLRRSADVSWLEAAHSWERTVVDPLLEAVERRNVHEAFRNRDVGDLYIQLSDHWYYLKQEKPWASPDEAVESFTRKFGNRLLRWFSWKTLRGGMQSLRRAWDRGERIDASVRQRKEQLVTGEDTLV